MPATTDASLAADFLNIKLSHIAVLVISLGLMACDDDSNNPSNLDLSHVRVNEELILYNPENVALQYDGGYRYIPAGRRGIIVYRATSTDYRAFERTCPYDPNAGCAYVTVDPSTLYMVDTCCGSTYDFYGQVTGGPSTRPLAKYSTNLYQNVLRITN